MAERVKKTAYIRCRGGSISCGYGCIGCGMCADACRIGAISFCGACPPVIDWGKCVGCGLCARACPQSIIEIINDDFNIQPKCSNKDAGKTALDACPNSCTACRRCEKSCPADAVHVIDNCPVIDPAKCICCGMCAVKCPRGVIRDIHGIITEKDV